MGRHTGLRCIGAFRQYSRYLNLKVRQNLTLNLGLRWSYFGALYSKENNMFVAVPGAGSNFLTGLVVKKGNSWTPEKSNFSPEIGFAWSPDRFPQKLVLRRKCEVRNPV